LSKRQDSQRTGSGAPSGPTDTTAPGVYSNYWHTEEIAYYSLKVYNPFAPSQTPSECVPGVRRPACAAGHSSPSSTTQLQLINIIIKNERSYTLNPPYTLMKCTETASTSCCQSRSSLNKKNT